ncbi:Tfp pilus assembly protein PilE [Povalibacter uvarum]|uniref:Tfp pilus assembly protein PilE n=1 Tax=Povalibacter uvarum TaxID=732238 RepID=A0A841HJ06_9GAMM|nr:hypothetical protein [Povalibacter uvarum]MBB6093191.1 Tfp pilus assembly protein PilE [Povalibacter uvarum]
MSARERLEQYLQQLQRRIRAHIYVRAGAVIAGVALVIVLATVWLLHRDGFAGQWASIGRVLLALTVILVSATLIAIPLHRLRRGNGARELERWLPEQGGRIETYLDARQREQSGQVSPLAELLASDALAKDRATPVREVIPASRLYAASAAIVAAVAILGFLLLAGPTFWGYGSRYLLLGAELPREAVPVRQIDVKPGDVTVRRNSDLTIRADVRGFSPQSAQVFVRFADQQEWERAPMQVVGDGEKSHWEFRLFALRGPLQYYVSADDGRNAERSADHNVAVVDLPKIERVKLTYRYPEWTDLPARTEDVVRDIRAVTDTEVQVEVFADAPLQAPALVVDGTLVEMEPTKTGGTGTIAVARPGNYHVSSRVAEEQVALTDEYRIDIVSDEKPTIEIRKPGRDWRATNIEEVPVAVQAQDDFRLQQVELRYSVNGGKEQSRRVASGSKQADVESLLRMEELGPSASGGESQLLAPGDLVSYYAVAKDRKQIVETDLFVVQVQPFERRFREGQGGGGGGGDDAAGEQGAISERQREILLATWNTQRSARTNSRSRAQLEDSAKMLAELQLKLATQARTLSERTRARASIDQDPLIRQFVESLEAAVKAMEPAAKHLTDFELESAIPAEQQALQQLLRAETAFRDVQVAMQRDQSGGGGQQAERNFTEMFELEMDVDKNHYETQSQLSQRNEREELDDALRKLKELAERQERLAQQANRAAQSREQRWQQEQLRREAEDLRRRLEELTRSQNSQQSARNSESTSAQEQSETGQSQTSQSQTGQSQNGQSQNGQSGSTSSAALQSMREALDEMRAANRDSDPRSAQEASRNLRRALDQLEQQPRGDSMADEVDRLADRAQKLVGEQRSVEAELYDALGDAMGSARQRGQLQPARSQRLVERKQQMADEVNDIQREMREALNDHSGRNPQSAKRLGDTLGELEGANLVHRLERSAAEIRYGRARDAAPREGLIAEALETLERDLRVISRVAANEAQGQQQAADPQQLLAELGDLRRALRDAESQRGNSSAQQNGAQQGSQGDANGQSGESSGGQGNGTDRTRNGLSAWDPSNTRQGTSGTNTPTLETGAGQFRSREAAEIGQRIEAMANQPGLALPQDEISALRRMAREARGLNGRSLGAQLDALSKLVDRLELATLASIEKSRNAPSAHTSASIPDDAEYREAVAEYYRRVGGNCTNAEGARPC